MKDWKLTIFKFILLIKISVNHYRVSWIGRTHAFQPLLNICDFILQTHFYFCAIRVVLNNKTGPKLWKSESERVKACVERTGETTPPQLSKRSTEFPPNNTRQKPTDRSQGPPTKCATSPNGSYQNNHNNDRLLRSSPHSKFNNNYASKKL